MMQDKGNLDEAFEEVVAKQQKQRTTTIALPKIDASSLPADLRMDEYSSDEDNDEQKRGVALGQMLVGASNGQSELLDEEEEDETDSDEKEIKPRQRRKTKAGDDEDSDDDFADVPDTREFEPIDLEGLQAMGLSHVGTNGGGMMLGDEEDDGSEMEDVRITEDDAMVLVAKTEDVSACLVDMISNKSSHRKGRERTSPCPRQDPSMSSCR